jgi:3-dehydroquinate synthase
MKLQTTYPSNNYPIYVEHGAIKYIGTYLNQFDQSFLLIDEYVNILDNCLKGMLFVIS